jgi:hypothetical protein
MTKRRKRECEICASRTGPWTEEDAYPRWLRKRILEYFRALPPSDVEAGWEQRARVLLKPVCESCQRRLNTLFELPAHSLIKLMIDGSVMSLTARQQVILAAWFTKTALVLGMAPMPTRADATPENIAKLRSHLCRMLEHGTPPHNATVRLAHISYSRQQPVWPPILPPELPYRGMYEVCSIVAVPGIVCETLIGPQNYLAAFIDATKHDYRFLRIWPQEVAEARWPPRLQIGPADLSALRAGWDHAPESIGGNFPQVTYPPPS